MKISSHLGKKITYADKGNECSQNSTTENIGGMMTIVCDTCDTLTNEKIRIIREEEVNDYKPI